MRSIFAFLATLVFVLLVNGLTVLLVEAAAGNDNVMASAAESNSKASALAATSSANSCRKTYNSAEDNPNPRAKR